MILKSAVVRKFRSIEDSGLVRFEPDVTCLVGMNESGKTAFLQALYRSNPLGRAARFQELRDYPRRLRSRERGEIPTTVPVTATFELQDGDVEAVWRQFGPGVLTSRELQVERTYGNRHRLTVHQDKLAQARHLLVKAGLDPRLADGADFGGLLARLEGELRRTRLTEVAEVMRELQGRDLAAELGVFLAARLPRFLYFDAFSVMPGRASIPRLQRTPEADLSPGERTVLALLRLAGVEAEEFSASGYEARRAALEAAANEVSDEVFRYWSQNRQLAVELDVDFASPAPRPGEDPPFLEIRIRNDRHRVTLSFGERSEGFAWFFSFLVAFSEFRAGGDVVLLLDEPGLGLHAAGQRDLLRYLHEQLARAHQVVYTTHSPFMVDAANLHRTRTVEDVDDQGTKVRNELDGAGRQTLAPLSGAVGYRLLHRLQLAPDTLLVEGPTELLYLEVLSGLLRDNGHEFLDPSWVLVPGGGPGGLPVLAALLGAPLEAAVLLDGGGDHLARLLAQRGLLLPERVVSVAELLGQADAGVEDLLGDGFYLRLLGAAGIGKPPPEEVQGPGRLVGRVERALGQPLDRYGVARTLLLKQAELLPGLPADTLDRFGALFGAVNRLLR